MSSALGGQKGIVYFLILALKYCILMLSSAWLINMLCGSHLFKYQIFEILECQKGSRNTWTKILESGETFLL